MPEKAAKLLRKLALKQRRAILATIEQLEAGDERGLDIKPIKGHKHLFRARVGDYRIIYGRYHGKYVQYDILKRDGRTYRDL